MGEGTGKALDCAAAELGRCYRVSKREKHLVGDLVREGELRPAKIRGEHNRRD